MKRRVPANTPWGDAVGYSRAVMSGKHIFVAGTTAVNEQGMVVGKEDAYAQAKYAISKIEMALEVLGASLSDVVRTRIFTTDVTKWKEIGRAHAEAFGKGTIPPAATMVQVSGFLDRDMLVEIEADAIISS